MINLPNNEVFIPAKAETRLFLHPKDFTVFLCQKRPLPKPSLHCFVFLSAKPRLPGWAAIRFGSNKPEVSGAAALRVALLCLSLQMVCFAFSC